MGAGRHRLRLRRLELSSWSEEEEAKGGIKSYEAVGKWGLREEESSWTELRGG